MKWLFFSKIIEALKQEKQKAEKIEQGEKELLAEKEEMEKREEEIIQNSKAKASQILEEERKFSAEEKQRILSKTEEEMRKILKETKEKANLEIIKAKKKYKEEVVDEAIDVLQKALSFVFSKELSRKYTKETIQELKEMKFSKIRKQEFKSIIVTSAFPLTREEVHDIKTILSSKLGGEKIIPMISFKVDPKLIAGISLNIEGFLIDGSIKGKINEYAKS